MQNAPSDPRASTDQLSISKQPHFLSFSAVAGNKLLKLNCVILKSEIGIKIRIRKSNNTNLK